MNKYWNIILCLCVRMNNAFMCVINRGKLEENKEFYLYVCHTLHISPCQSLQGISGCLEEALARFGLKKSLRTHMHNVNNGS